MQKVDLFLRPWETWLHSNSVDLSSWNFFFITPIYNESAHTDQHPIGKMQLVEVIIPVVNEHALTEFQAHRSILNNWAWYRQKNYFFSSFEISKLKIAPKTI